MSDRLKQIWSGFETETTRNLTGSGIDNIHVPHRREWRARDDNFLPENFEAPAERAFAALNWKLEADLKKQQKHRKKSKNVDTFMYANEDDYTETIPAGRRYAPGHPLQSNRQTPQQSLMASLQETDFRVLRREINYTAYGAADTEKVLNARRRKKFLGVF